MKRKILSTLLVIGALSFPIPTFATEEVQPVVNYEETIASEETVEEAVAEVSESTEDVVEVSAEAEETTEADDTTEAEVTEETTEKVDSVEEVKETVEETISATEEEATIVELPEITVTQEYHAVDADVVGDMLVKDDMTLSNHRVVNGDLTVWGYLDLDGYSLQVNGNVYAENGINVGDGKLTVTGNCLLEEGEMSVDIGKIEIGGSLLIYGVNASGDKVTGSGEIDIHNEGGSLVVGGDLIMNTTGDFCWDMGGTITVKGDVIEEKVGYYGLAPNKLVLAGSEEQLLQLTNGAYIYNLELKNPKVKVAGYLNGTLVSNAKEITLADGVFRTSDLDMNGYSMVIPGNVEATGDFRVRNGSLTVTGDYMQKGASLQIEAGKATINGDFNICSTDVDGEKVTGTGEYDIFNESGSLNVDGNLYMNTSNDMYWDMGGTITVKGDVIEEKVGDYGLAPNKLVLAGSEEQLLQLNNDAYIHNLELKNPKVKVAGYLNGKLISHAKEITLADEVFRTSDLDMNGYNMVIPGNVEATGDFRVRNGNLTVTGDYMQKGASLQIDAGKATINGNFNICSTNVDGEKVTGTGEYDIFNESGSLNVDGNLYMNTSNDMYWDMGGTVTVKGDVIEEKAGNSGYHPNKLVLAGSKEQLLQLTNESNINNLELKNPKVKVAGYLNGTLISNAKEITLADGVFRTGYLDMNGYSMVIPGNVEATGNFVVRNGSLTVTGDYMQKDYNLQIDAGKATINGDLNICSTNVDGEKVTGNGEYDIFNDSGSLFVDGDLYMNTEGDFYWDMGGTTTVKGDVIEEKVGSNGIHPNKLVLAGSEEQLLQLTKSSYVSNLEFKNPKVKIAGYINGKLVSNANEITLADGVFRTSNLNLNGCTMTIPGNMEASGDVSLNAGTLNVTGNYMQKTGCLHVGTGKATINGDMQVSTTDTDGNIVTGDGYFCMDEGGNLVVNKSLLLNTSSGMTYYMDGIITVKGDLIQECAANSNPSFKPSYVIMAGNGAQKVSFASSNAWIGTLELKQKTKFYTINPKPCYDKLIELKVLVTKITLNKTSATMKMGETVTLTATVAPTDATNKKVTWSSSNTKVATVDANGKVTPKALGTVVIKATAQDTSKVSASCTVKITAVPAKPYKITNVVSGVHVYWKEVAGASKYGLWRSENGKNGTYKWIANPTVAHFTDTTAVSGKTYHYKVTAVDVDGKHGDKSEAIGVVYVSTPDITSRINKAAGIQLGWNKITGATGYAIYRKSYAGTDAWARVGTISGNNTFTWTDTGVKNSNGTVYRYTVRALAGSDMKTLSGCRNTGRTMTRLSSRVLNSATKVTGGIECKWTTSAAVTGYEVRFMVGSDVVKTYTVGNYKTGSMVFKGLTAGKTYKIQVRSYKKVTGVGSFYSAWSEAKTVKY